MKNSVCLLLLHAIGLCYGQISRINAESLHLLDHNTNYYFAVNLVAGHPQHDDTYRLHKRAVNVAEELGYMLVGQIGDLKGHYLVSTAKTNEPTGLGLLDRVYGVHTMGLHKRALESHSFVEWVEPQVLKRRVRKRQPPDEFDVITNELGMMDPFLKAQWHLHNRQLPGADLNVANLWKQNITGRGVISAVIDDG